MPIPPPIMPGPVVSVGPIICIIRPAICWWAVIICCICAGDHRAIESRCIHIIGMKRMAWESTAAGCLVAAVSRVIPAGPCAAAGAEA